MIWSRLVSSESESELLYDWRFTANHFVLATSPLRLTTSNFIFQLNTCGYSPYVTSSLARGLVCRLQLLLSSPAQSFSGPSPAGLMTTFYCLRFTHSVSFSKSKSKSCYDRRSVGQSDLVSSPHLGLKTRLSLLSDDAVIFLLYNPGRT
jgi:hypothetical protein